MDNVITLWWSRESWYDFFLRLGWNFLLGVILFVLVSFYVLVQSIKSCYDFSPSWLKFSSWCDSVCLGVILCLSAINWILVWFFSVLVEIFVLVWFCLSRCHFMSWCNQLDLGMIFVRFATLFCFSVILSDLVSFYILVRLTTSWCDLCVLVCDVLYISFYFCM